MLVSASSYLEIGNDKSIDTDVLERYINTSAPLFFFVRFSENWALLCRGRRYSKCKSGSHGVLETKGRTGDFQRYRKSWSDISDTGLADC
jgi:hypothetical protein